MLFLKRDIGMGDRSSVVIFRSIHTRPFLQNRYCLQRGAVTIYLNFPTFVNQYWAEVRFGKLMYEV
ncbi:hypothetical protein HQ36_03525 [Porphyromonas gingivicanis]|uniref:Uncharacterized protein n=1 Tax=Porphyromonas gingivicanis TaxID=266762 RepID=A0A0A2G450_9PORP|nr:hypothetical protein HQ36_03525 [Porphyromonas gingivicanis]